MKALMKRVSTLERNCNHADVAVIICRKGESLDQAKVRWTLEHPDRDLNQSDLQIVMKLVEPDPKETFHHRIPLETAGRLSPTASKGE